MALATSRTGAPQLHTHRGSGTTALRNQPELRFPHRRDMVLLGCTVLGASLLGTIIGHVLSAPPI